MERAEPQIVSYGEAIRRRPGMYIGEPGPEAVQHLIDELSSNAIDQFLMGHATFVGVRVHDDGSIEVTDDGPGLPFDETTPDGTSIALYDLTEPHFTPRADSHAPHIHIHLRRGVGSAVVNHCSTQLTCLSWRNGQLWEALFANGEPIDAPHITATGTSRGTSIRFYPNVAVVGAAQPASATLRSALWQAAHLFPGLEARYNDEVFIAPHGLRDLAQLHDNTAAIRRAEIGSPQTFSWQGRHDDYQIDAAASGYRGIETYWRTWVNGRETPLHGVHRDAFADVLESVGWEPAAALIHVITYETRYAHPTRDKYVFAPASEAIHGALAEPLEAFCRAHQIGRYAKK